MRVSSLGREVYIAIMSYKEITIVVFWSLKLNLD